MLFLLIDKQWPECTYVALLDDFMLGCFLILEWHRIWLASDGLQIGFELHVHFTTGPLPLFAFKDGLMLLEDGEQFALLGHGEMSTFLCYYCLEIVFLIGCLFQTCLCLEHLLSRFTT